MNEMMRSGESWNALLKQYRIKNIKDDPRDGWNSGKIYHVRSIMFVHRDGGFGFRMTCNCAARKRCRHIDAVEQMRYAEERVAAQNGDTDGMEILERTEA